MIFHGHATHVALDADGHAEVITGEIYGPPEAASILRPGALDEPGPVLITRPALDGGDALARAIFETFGVPEGTPIPDGPRYLDSGPVVDPDTGVYRRTIVREDAIGDEP